MVFGGLRRIVEGAVILGVVAAGGCGDSLYLGYEYHNFGGKRVEHATHPDDAGFLTGSAGTTEFKDGHFFKVSEVGGFGEEYDEPYYYWQVSALVGVGDDRKKNENDYRSTGHHSEIYTKVFPLAPQVGVGVDYKVSENFWIGGEVSATAFYRESGWRRHGHDENSETEWEYFVNIGPTFKLEDGDRFWRLQAGVGTDGSFGGGVTCSY